MGFTLLREKYSHPQSQWTTLVEGLWLGSSVSSWSNLLSVSNCYIAVDEKS